MNLMAASMDPRWRQSRTIPDPAPDGTKVDRDYKQAEQASPPWTRQDGPSCTTSVGPGVTPPQCSPRPSRQRRDAATCAATYGQTGPCYFSRCFAVGRASSCSCMFTAGAVWSLGFTSLTNKPTHGLHAGSIDRFCVSPSCVIFTRYEPCIN